MSSTTPFWGGIRKYARESLLAGNKATTLPEVSANAMKGEVLGQYCPSQLGNYQLRPEGESEILLNSNRRPCLSDEN